jgi:NAD(P)-dependent dehydrogenase (short-subunit alcohol dehydrogenase family)
VEKQGTDDRRTALVTGASQGLGAAIAVELARCGYDVAVSNQGVAPLDATLASIEEAGARGVPVKLDLRMQSSIEQAMSAVLDAFGRLDVLVNNAGVTLRKAALEVTPEEWDEVTTVNLTGTFFMCQQMARQLVATDRPGAIVNIASTHGLLGFPMRSTYGITKAGIIHMTRMLAYEWAGRSIRVNAVAPGTVETPSRAAYFASDPKAREGMLSRVPMRRFGLPADVAGAVCYLAGPAADYVTGQTLVLDGGLTSY